jgi:hypothetical protein
MTVRGYGSMTTGHAFALPSTASVVHAELPGEAKARGTVGTVQCFAVPNDALREAMLAPEQTPCGADRRTPRTDSSHDFHGLYDRRQQRELGVVRRRSPKS